MSYSAASNTGKIALLTLVVAGISSLDPAEAQEKADPGSLVAGCLPSAKNLNDKAADLYKNFGAGIALIPTSDPLLSTYLRSEIDFYSKQLSPSFKATSISIVDVDLTASSILTTSPQSNYGQHSFGQQSHLDCDSGGFNCSLKYNDVGAQFDQETYLAKQIVDVTLPSPKITNVTLFVPDPSADTRKAVDSFRSALVSISGKLDGSQLQALRGEFDQYLAASQAYRSCYQTFDAKVFQEMTSNLDGKKTNIDEAFAMTSTRTNVKDSWRILNDLSKAQNDITKSKLMLDAFYNQADMSFKAIP